MMVIIRPVIIKLFERLAFENRLQINKNRFIIGATILNDIRNPEE